MLRLICALGTHSYTISQLYISYNTNIKNVKKDVILSNFAEKKNQKIKNIKNVKNGIKKK